MCLLLIHPAATAFDRDDIDDFYTYNSDGVGVMWAEGGLLHTYKYLPKNAEQAWAFYKDHVLGKECVVHWRMRTHGDIDLTNCHPYEVFGDGSTVPMSMMHNGILHTGNARDTRLSDTWHYIEDYIKPVVGAHPDIIFEPAFIKLLAYHIGAGNKFVFLDHLGRMAVVNEAAFVKYKGAMLSNTYAWSAEKGGYGLPRFKSHGSWDYNYGAPLTPYEPKEYPIRTAPALAWGDDDYDYDYEADATFLDDFIEEFYDAGVKLHMLKLAKAVTHEALTAMWHRAGADYCYDFLESMPSYIEEEVLAEINAWADTAIEEDDHDYASARAY